MFFEAVALTSFLTSGHHALPAGGGGCARASHGAAWQAHAQPRRASLVRAAGGAAAEAWSRQWWRRGRLRPDGSFELLGRARRWLGQWPGARAGAQATRRDLSTRTTHADDACDCCNPSSLTVALLVVALWRTQMESLRSPVPTLGLQLRFSGKNDIRSLDDSSVSLKPNPTVRAPRVSKPAHISGCLGVPSLASARLRRGTRARAPRPAYYRLPLPAPRRVDWQAAGSALEPRRPQCSQKAPWRRPPHLRRRRRACALFSRHPASRLTRGRSE